MLTHLHISNYALIRSLDIDWDGGFSVITGETGAGKSIMLGAINLLLGGRADAKSIQAGAAKCCVEATFSLEDNGLAEFFSENDIDYDPAECIVRREVTQTGKSRAFVNDTPVTAARLRELGDKLIDVHSQHQNLLIRNEHFLLDTLDLVAGNAGVAGAYREAFVQHRRASEELKRLRESAERAKAEQEYIEYRLKQIDDAQLREGEQEELEQEQRTLSHAEEIRQGLYTAQGCLDGEERGIPSALRQASSALSALGENLSAAPALAERLDSVRIEVEDIAGEIERLTAETEYDPQRLEYVEARLDLIYGLEQKHQAADLAALLQTAETLRGQLDGIANADDDIARLQRETDALAAKLHKAAADLTASREKAARALEKELGSALKNLGMPAVNVELRLAARAVPDATGADCVTFLFSANRNVPPQDVSRIASGGEIARLMLALKAIMARRTQLPAIVFDEIDTGVSGTMAEKMAQLMRSMSDSCQVICITHLPQIAALGTRHYKVYKEDADGAAQSHIVCLTPEERVAELANMLSGEKVTQAALDNARALLSGTPD